MTELTIDVAVLLYGDYPKLAERCLSSLQPLVRLGIPVRVYANEPSDRTLSVARSLGHEPIVFSPQRYKYPVMRLAVAESTASLFMWFDDDSCLMATDAAGWLAKLRAVFRSDADVVGSIYVPSLFTEQQKAWAKTRPWYAGLPISSKPRFVTGGWWTARRSVLTALDWPDLTLRHRGGDVALGVACAQNGFKLVHFNRGVAINADEALRESKSVRRGYDEKSAGDTGWRAYEAETNTTGSHAEVPKQDLQGN